MDKNGVRNGETASSNIKCPPGKEGTDGKEEKIT